VENQWKVAEPSETVNNCGVNGVGRYPKQLDPQVREQNRRVPKLLEEKLQHLCPEEVCHCPKTKFNKVHS
jgi:hypothetical protein